MSAPPHPSTAAELDVRRRALRELVLVAVLFLAYKLGRFMIQGSDAMAFDNAWSIWHLERHLHLPNEVVVQHAWLGSHLALRGANIYYAYVHFPVTAAFLLWMYLRRPEHYRWARRAIAALTASALIVHVLMPLAPPRMLTPTGMVDTGRLVGPAVYGDVSRDTFINQYAAMPSLHVGWALAVAVGVIAVTRGHWRWAALLHPLVTVAVVVVTGNHYWLDAVVGAGLLAVVLAVVPWPESTRLALDPARHAPAPANVAEVPA